MKFYDFGVQLLRFWVYQSGNLFSLIKKVAQRDLLYTEKKNYSPKIKNRKK
jgi:hypothetical protein